MVAVRRKSVNALACGHWPLQARLGGHDLSLRIWASPIVFSPLCSVTAAGTAEFDHLFTSTTPALVASTRSGWIQRLKMLSLMECPSYGLAGLLCLNFCSSSRRIRGSLHRSAAMHCIERLITAVTARIWEGYSPPKKRIGEDAWYVMLRQPVRWWRYISL